MSFLLSWLSKLLASILVSVLAGAFITGVLSQTVLSSHYIEGHLASTNSYVRLSDALNTQITAKAVDSGSPQMVAQLKTIITPTVLQTKINSALDQFQTYYRGNGPAPVIDLSYVAAQAEAAGIPVPADSGITKPIQLGGSQKVRGFSKTFDQIRLSTILATLVLTAALLGVSWERHKWAALPDVLISVGFLVGLLTLVFGLAPSLATHYIKFDTTSNAFAPIGSDLATSIAHDLAVRFGIVAGIFVVVGIGTRVWVARRHSPGHMPIKTALKTGYQQPLKVK